MADIQLPLTAAADTGTGALMVAYRMSGDLAQYRESSPIAQAGFLQLKRVEPKPTKDYAGAMRGEVKFTRAYADTTGRLWPAVVTVSSSLPAFLTDTQRADIVMEALIAARVAAGKDTLSKLAVPQS